MSSGEAASISERVVMAGAFVSFLTVLRAFKEPHSLFLFLGGGGMAEEMVRKTERHRKGPSVSLLVGSVGFGQRQLR